MLSGIIQLAGKSRSLKEKGFFFCSSIILILKCWSQAKSITAEYLTLRIRHMADLSTSKSLITFRITLAISCYPFLPSPVPTPRVIIIEPPNTALITGSSAVLVCRTDLNEAVDTPVAVTVEWRGSGVTLSSESRIVISNIEQSSPLRYESNLTISTLSIQDSGVYSCVVTIGHQPTSPFITDNTGSATTTITVTGWGRVFACTSY